MNTWKHQAEPTSQKFACEHQEADNTEGKRQISLTSVHGPSLRARYELCLFSSCSLRGVSSVACGKPNFADGAVWEHQA